MNEYVNVQELYEITKTPYCLFVILIGHTSSAYNYLNQASSIIHSAKTSNVWRNIPFKNQSGYFPYRKINFRVGNQLTIRPPRCLLFPVSDIIFRV